MPTNEPHVPKAVRRDEARLKAQELREQQKKRDRRNRIVAISGLVAALAVLAIVVVVILGQGKSTADVAYTGDAITVADSNPPATAQEDGGIPVGPDGIAGTTSDDAEAVVVDIYLDFMCPVCGTFEEVNGAALADMRASGEITVVYHPVAILDRYSQGTEFSTRSAIAVAAVADAAPEAFVAFSDALFANQPEENTTGLSDEEIAQIALDAGVPQSVVDTFTEQASDGEWRTFSPFVAALTAQSTADLDALGQQMATPTILLDGAPLDSNTYNWSIDGQLAAAIEAAAAA